MLGTKYIHDLIEKCHLSDFEFDEKYEDNKYLR